MSIASKQSNLDKAGRPYVLKNNLLIYPSKGGIEQNLNAAGKNANNQAIVCRHFAWQLASSPDGIKNYHDQFSSIESIEAIPELKNNVYDQTEPRFNASHYQFFNITELGEQLRLNAETLESNQKKTFLFSSENHLMAFEIHKKAISEEKSEYILKFYDPNITNKHKRIIAENLSDITNLSIHDLISDEQINLYFPKFESAYFFSTSQKTKAPEIEISETIAPHEILSYLLEIGLLQHKPEVIDNLIHADTSNPKKNLTKLLAKSTENLPGLYIALLNNHADTIKSYMHHILSSKIKNSNKVRLLSAKDDLGYPGLYIALFLGNIDAVKAYTQAILDSSLDLEQKFELLTAHATNKNTGIIAAFSRNQYNTIKIYLQCIFDSKALTDDQKTSFLNKYLSTEQLKKVLPYNPQIQKFDDIPNPTHLIKKQLQNIMDADNTDEIKIEIPPKNP